MTVTDDETERREPERVPLRAMRLQDFKSVRSAEVELRGLTVVVGKNSSGKSTLLQGVLALAQAARVGTHAPVFPLNEALVSLGRVRDVVRFGSELGAGAGLGCTLGVDVAIRSRESIFGWLAQRDRRFRDATVEWDIRIGRDDSLSAGRARIEAVSLSLRGADASDEIDSSIELREFGAASDPSAGSSDPFGAPVVSRSVAGEVHNRRDGTTTAVTHGALSGGLPIRASAPGAIFESLFGDWWSFAGAIVPVLLAEETAGDAGSEAAIDEFDAAEWAVRFAADMLERQPNFEMQSYIFQWMPRGAGADGDESGVGGTYVNDEEEGQRPLTWREIVLQYRYPWAIDHPEFEPRIMLEHRFGELGVANLRSLTVAMDSLGRQVFCDRVRAELRERAIDWVGLVGTGRDTLGLGDAFESAAEAVRRCFGMLRYLGPLRAGGQPVYPAGSNRDDLGPDGRYAAAFLHENSQEPVLVPDPAGGAQLMALGDGLNLWLEELGLADRAVTEDRDRLGIGLSVRPIGRDEVVDLTAVGVGVSQALPVVLLCLLTPPGGIVVLEQPELHLHPAMQLRIADFLLACAGTGRQIIVETHSEHLVNRLRRRVAEDETSETADRVRLLFAEQEEGVTEYRVSDVNPLGGLDADWPRGFLDVGAQESARFLDGTLAKKRRLDSSGA